MIREAQLGEVPNRQKDGDLGVSRFERLRDWNPGRCYGR